VKRAVSIVVCTRGRPLAALDVVRDVLGQAGDGDEVVVVDQSEPADRDAVARALARLADVRVRHLPAPADGLPAARNLGLQATRGEVVLFLDDDVRLRPGCLAAHRAAYAALSIGGVVGRIEERTVRPNAPRTTNRLGPGGRVLTNLEGRAPVDVATLKGANMSFRRAALLAAGPADPRYVGAALLEDADWSTRVAALGWRLRFVPEAAVAHLSLPAGGCRVASAQEREASRFRSTGTFVRLHRPWTAPLVAATFSAIAARRAMAWRSPRAVLRLLGALADGWRRGAPAGQRGPEDGLPSGESG
jgi:GT2 family glycosyltransferase